MANPVFCADCGNKMCFDRFEQMDIKSESGVIYEECFKCRLCGRLTWHPTKENYTVKEAE
jgi:hypothetical protein